MNIIKNLCIISSLLVCTAAFAQQMDQQLDRSNPDLIRNVRTETRHEIIIPDIDGYKVVKTDLHVHTIFSDADATPEFRVKEAWRDGLDAIAITDHIEYHPTDAKFANYLCIEKPANRDLNLSVSLARKYADRYGLTLIAGTEITRSAQAIGHFNALFTTDNNLIPDSDPFVAIQNAKKQNALVQINHPGWARRDANLTETAQRAIAAGLVDGVECINDKEFYQKGIEYGCDNKLFISSNTDLHGSVAFTWGESGLFRNMTLVFAKDASAESIKEALVARRTLAYGFGDICGRIDLLEKFFLGSFDFKVISEDSKGNRSILVTNKSSFPYYLITPGMNTGIKISGLCSAIVSLKSGDKLAFTVQNMWHGIDKHPVFEIAVPEK